jgi:catechol 2,3-dioxygenase-like lactoylglutathione lyase family enzyme
MEWPEERMPAQTRVHIHLTVSDLARSQDFYTRFFGVAPVKEQLGYVKFLRWEVYCLNYDLDTRGRGSIIPLQMIQSAASACCEGANQTAS